MTADAVRLVIVEDRSLRWAVLADEVSEIVDGATWRGEPPMDVAARWSERLAGVRLPPARSVSPGHAIVVRTMRGEYAFWSPRISFAVTERSRVLTLPHLLASGRGARMVAGIVFGDSDQPLIVLSPDGLLDRDGRAPAEAVRSR